MRQSRSTVWGVLRWAAGAVIVVTCSVVATTVYADDEETRWSGHARLGLEYDDNPHRLEADDREARGESGAPLTRYLVSGDIVTDMGPSGQVSASVDQGAKLFYGERDANTVLTELRTAGTWRPGGQLFLQLRADVKDRTESGEFRRDYTRGGAGVRLGRSFGPVRGWGHGGWRFLAFKPSPQSSHRGPRIGAGGRWQARNDLHVDASWARTWRAYSMTAWEVIDDRFVPVGDGVTRADEYDVWQLAVRHQRRINAGLRIQYAKNRSNSHGQQMRRVGLEASLTVPVMWDIFVSARGEIQRGRYEDPVIVDDVLQLDEDHRNAVVTAISRPLSDRWDIELRHSLFTQEFGAGREYRRQTVALGVRAYLDEVK